MDELVEEIYSFFFKFNIHSDHNWSSILLSKMAKP